MEPSRLETYYKPQHLADFGKIAEGSPDLGKKFFDYYAAVFADGALAAALWVADKPPGLYSMRHVVGL